MIVDTSAIIAILRDEAEALACARAIDSAGIRRISAANFVEAAIVIDGSRDPIASRRFDDLIKEAQLVIKPVTEAQARIAREAYRDFGKGSGHSAKLNFGDCFAYALAKDSGEPLLYKGDDFKHTDILGVEK
jgi:ribonuclease VapC